MADDEFGILNSLASLRFGREVSPEAGVEEVKGWGADVVLGWMRDCDEAGDLDMLERYLDNEGLSLCEAFGPEVQQEVNALRQKLKADWDREDELGIGSLLNADHPHAIESLRTRHEVEDLYSQMQASSAYRAAL